MSYYSGSQSINKSNQCQRNTKQNIHEHQNEEKYYNFQREQSKEWAIATDFQHDSIKSAGNLLESLKEQMCFQSWYLDEERYLGVARKMSDTWQKRHKQSGIQPSRSSRLARGVMETELTNQEAACRRGRQEMNVEIVWRCCFPSLWNGSTESNKLALYRNWSPSAVWLCSSGYRLVPGKKSKLDVKLEKRVTFYL